MNKPVIGALACLLALATGCEPSVTPHPNIVVIMADDMGYGDLQSYNPESKIPTPNMDRLAAEGMRFTDAHSPSAVCTPTRYSLLTGRYAWRLPALESGVTQGYDPLIIDTMRVTIARMLKDEGYTSAVIGKWHLGLGKSKPTRYGLPLAPGPRALGFDYFYGIPASLDMPPYVWVENESVVEAATDSTEDSVPCCSGPFWRGGPIAPSFAHADVLPVITEKAVAYVQERAQDAAQQPFFLYVPLAAPHTPWVPTAEYRGTSGAGEYGDFTVQVDATIGAIMAALEEGGLGEETLLIVMSDNGAYWSDADINQFDHRSNHAWRGMKADIHEGGHRVPFIARWPGRVPAGTLTDQLAVHTDLYATFAEIVGARLAPSSAEDSFSLLEALYGARDMTARPEAVHQSIRGMLALRRGPWKYIDGKGSGGFTRVDTSATDPPGQLYHLGDDPGETRNLFLERPEKVKELQDILAAIRDATGSRPGAGRYQARAPLALSSGNLARTY